MAALVIRPATEKDADAIHAMIVALARDTGKSKLVTSTADDIRRDGFGARPAFQALIACRGERPVGLALHFAEYSTWRGRRGVYLQDLYVAPEARGAGVGARLIAALAVEAATRGAVYMRLAVDAENHQAARFYERLGFVEHEEDRMFFLDHAAFEKAAQGRNE